MSLRMLDLFCGLGGASQPMVDSPKWDVTRVDIRDDVAADVVADVRQLPFSSIEDLDFLWASPPCTEFSTAANGTRGRLGVNEIDFGCILATVQAVHELDPTWWVLENVHGACRYLVPLLGPYRSNGSYFIWGDPPPVDHRTIYRKGCSWDADRTQGQWEKDRRDPLERAKIPYDLANVYRRAVETWEGVHKQRPGGTG